MYVLLGYMHPWANRIAAATRVGPNPKPLCIVRGSRACFNPKEKAQNPYTPKKAQTTRPYSRTASALEV